MHIAHYGKTTPDKPAFVIAETGETSTFGEIDRGSCQLAHVFEGLGLRKGDGIALMIENHPRFFDICWAALRSGLYYTAISYRLQEEEVDYIVRDCGAKVFITSKAHSGVAERLLDHLDGVACFMLDGVIPGYQPLEDAMAAAPETPLDHEEEGLHMLYSSGTTGKPKGVRHPLPDQPPGGPAIAAAVTGIGALFGFDEDTIYLCPAPLYHSAGLFFNIWVQRLGGTCVVMEHFDAENALKAIETWKVTHSQWVPTMFVRMLRLPEPDRMKYDVSSMKVAIHAAAPCPVPIKEQMIDWWGPIILEYYGGTEGVGMTWLDSEMWLQHKGSVGRVLAADVTLHILDEETGEDLPTGEIGMVYFDNPAMNFEYHNDAEKTAASRSKEGFGTLGDIGYMDDEGFLYLTDRKANMIISGGVNIYPQEAENILITHPKVEDVAVFGVPNEEFGEEVKAVVQPVDAGAAGPELAAELMDYCKEQISHIKCPRSIDFDPELPRHPTGKLYKRLIKDRYWEGHGKSRIL